MYRPLSIFAMVMLLPAIASAAIEDHGEYTLDTDTGNLWIDVTQTRGITWEEANAEMKPTGDFAGCRFPNRGLVENFIGKLGLPPKCGPGFTVSCPAPEVIEDAIRLLGDTHDAQLDELNADNDVAADGAGYTRGFYNAGGDALYIFDDELVDRSTGLPVRDFPDYVDADSTIVADSGARNQGVLLICDTWPPQPLNSRVIDFEDVAPGTTGPVISDGYQVTGDATAASDGNNIVVETTPCTNCNGLLDYSTSQTFARADGEPFALFAIDDFTTGAAGELGNCSLFKDDVGVGFEECGIIGTTTWGEKVLYQRGSSFLYPSTFGETYPLGEGPWLNLESLTIQLRAVPTYDPEDGCVAPCQFAIDNVEVNDAIDVDIDFDPYSDADIMNPTLDNFIVVQISTEAGFSGADVKSETVRLGPDKATLAASIITDDQDGDGDIDYYYGFRMQDTGIECIHTRIILSGETDDGRAFAASDDVVMDDACFETVPVDLEPFDPDNKVYPEDNFPVQVLIKHMNDFYGDPYDFRPSSVSDIRLGSGRTKSVSYIRYGDFYNGGYDYLATFRIEDSGITCDDTEVEIVGSYNFASDAEAFRVYAPIDPQDCADDGCHP